MSLIPYIQAVPKERVVGANSPTYADVTNRPLKYVIAQSGLIDTQDFYGLASGSTGSGSPEAVKVGRVGDIYGNINAVNEHPIWYKYTGAGFNVGWKNFNEFPNGLIVDSGVVGITATTVTSTSSLYTTLSAQSFQFTGTGSGPAFEGNAIFTLPGYFEVDSVRGINLSDSGAFGININASNNINITSALTLSMTGAGGNNSMDLRNTGVIILSSVLGTVFNMSATGLFTGNFAVTGHVTPSVNNIYDLGTSSFLWRSAYLGTNLQIGTTVSTTGEIRLPNIFAIKAREVTNARDVGVFSFSSRTIIVGQNATTADLSQIEFYTAIANQGLRINGTGGLDATSSNTQDITGWRHIKAATSLQVAFASLPASTGEIRLSNAATITWRNAASSGDIGAITVNSSNQLVLGAGTTGILYSASLLPNFDNTLDSGSSIFRWRSVYAGTSFISTVLDSGAASDLILRRNGVTQLTLASLSATFTTGIIGTSGSFSQLSLISSGTSAYGFTTASLIAATSTAFPAPFNSAGNLLIQPRGDASRAIIFATFDGVSTSYRWQIAGTGHLLTVDNTYDIGAAGATRPRTGYFGTSIISAILDSGSATDLILKRNAITQLTLASLSATFAGDLIITGNTRVGTAGGTAATNIVILVNSTLGTTGLSQVGIQSSGTIPTTATTTYFNFYGGIVTGASVYTVTSVAAYCIASPNIGAGSIVTTGYGILINVQTWPASTVSAIGIDIGNVSGASLNNWAFRTGLGDVRLGDKLLASTDNSYDIGAAGANRFRTGYFGTSIVFPTLAAGNNSTNGATTGYVDRTSGLASKTVAAPALTASLVGVMMGLALACTPTKGTKLIVIVTGAWANSILSDGVKIQIRYGTGAAPANGAALTGTAVGSLRSYTAAVAARPDGFCLAFPISGLTINTAYWIDVSLTAVTGGNATITDVDMVATETY